MFEINLDSPREVACLWSNLLEPADAAAGILISELGSAAALAWLLNSGKPADLPPRLHYSETGRALPWAQAVARWLPRLAEVNVRAQLAQLENQGGALWYPEHPRWPSQFNDLEQAAPVALWVRGNLAAAPPKAQIALVGARAATSEGEQIAAELSYQLTESGYSVVSGGAFGIDAAAHRGALQAALHRSGNTAAGPVATVAFMAGGINQLYPVSQLELFQQIDEVGLIMSEVPPSWRPAKWRFLARNRLIAAFSQAVVVVEAGVRSGALATAHRGLELGRQVGAIPGSIYSQMSLGCHQLIRNSNATLISRVQDIKEMVLPVSEAFQMELQLEGAVTEEKQFTTAEAERVWLALPKRGQATISSVAAAAGLSFAEVTAALAELVVAGQAEVAADQCWRVI